MNKVKSKIFIYEDDGEGELLIESKSTSSEFISLFFIFIDHEQFYSHEKIICFSSSLLFFSISNAQIEERSFIYDAASVPRDHPLDFSKMQLSLSFEPSIGLVKGKVTHYFISLRPKIDSFFLDGINMNIKEITLNGKAVTYHRNNAGIEIMPTEPLQWNTHYVLYIDYEATPRRGLYFVGWNDKNNLSRKQVWTQGEAIDNRQWIPMYDEKNDKLISEVTVTFDKDYQVLSNGKLLEQKNNNDGTNTWHYLISHPHAPYLVMLGIGKYGIKETHSASGVPMHLYYYPEWKDRVEPTYQHSEGMVDFFEKKSAFLTHGNLIRRYPFRIICLVLWRIPQQRYSEIFI